ncbi:MAG: cyclic pyranopterin monophosphate synthase MoaC [Desulfovibrionaceae bacterium]|nr:cyclic pyranopterin monophosphate synthase MoaC [Desulfovibrionaceae bacterium]
MTQTFSHVDAEGNVQMVDVGHKQNTQRIALVEAFVEVNEHTMLLLKNAALPKGDVLTTAKIAGIMAAKRTAELIPLCHPLALSYADIRFEVRHCTIRIEAEVRTNGATGVEMEGIIAAQTAAATIYDMCKAVQKDIIIRNVRLLKKTGGKSGIFTATSPTPAPAEQC